MAQQAAHGGALHHHTPVSQMKKAFALTLIVLVVELFGSMLSHSLALLSDAGHVLTDIAAIGLSWYALAQAQKPPDEAMTFGYHRTGILAAMINGATLIAIALVIVWQAWGRFQHPQPTSTLWMIVSAGIGLAINLYLGLQMRAARDINVRSAVLHMLGDAAASGAVVVAAVVIGITSWYVVDPVLSVLIAVLIGFGAWRLLKETAAILMERAPRDVDGDQVIALIRRVRGIEDVHDVHLWSITDGRNALSCHVVLDGAMTIRESQRILRRLEQDLVAQGIGHVTIQTEDGTHPHEDSVLCADEPLERPSH